MKTVLIRGVVGVMVTAFALTTAGAQGPKEFFRNLVKPVEADPQKEYLLTEMEGPYLIFAAAFSGPNAKQEAHALVMEFRKTRKWNAFVYEKNFVFDVNQDFNQARNPYSGKTVKYRTANGGTEFAVVIGNFTSIEDKQFEKTLAEVRKWQPASPQGKSSATPCSMAFGLQNPILPPENQRGIVDDFIQSINEKRPYTLLKNPKRYTVQIATFTGRTVFEKSASALDKISFSKTKKTDLEMGEQAAVALCKALREQGVEAYEFHDRYASIVTVGSFNQHSQRLPNGTTAVDPEVQQIIQRYQGQVTGNSYKPVIINHIECDLQPHVIEVPRVRR
ncbi:MAG: hypothetical protein LBI05_03830 [Planctomycetaceae bacterium]|jgi:hypothetical protein|nr:hypothetical protein [Planctomycetaceae bacterium]